MLLGIDYVLDKKGDKDEPRFYDETQKNTGIWSISGTTQAKYLNQQSPVRA